MEAGADRYKIFVEICHRSPKFHEEFEEFHPVDWQYSDWVWMDKTTEGCLVRSTGGSKTFDTIIWLILRVLMYPKEHWAWVAAASGQLTQARQYFLMNPFVKKISGASGKEQINLLNGRHIYLRSATKGITGLRLDGIILDEEEMLQPNQVEIVYPQLHGRLSKSKTGKFFHLGTMQYMTLFMQNLNQYPTRVRPWNVCPWLVEAGKIQTYIDDGVMPNFEINMLYRCIADVPGGAFFTNLKSIDPYQYNQSNVIYGMDFGNLDHAVGVIVDRPNNKCTIVEEYKCDLEKDQTGFDFLRGSHVEGEGGGYNDSPRYSAKSQLMVKRIHATRVPMTHKFKQDRKLMARGFVVIEVIEKNCPETWLDMQGCQFGKDYLWLKDKTHGCHWVDAFMHSIKANSGRTWTGSPSRKNSIRQEQRRRERYRS